MWFLAALVLQSQLAARVLGDESDSCAVEEGYVTDLARAFGCNVACGTQDGASRPLAAIGCIFSSVYTSKAVHGGAWHAKREMTYGEMLPEGFQKLFDGYGLLGVPAGSNDVFADMGSGTGKLVIQSFLHGLRKSYGVELAEDRYKSGAEALASLHAKMGGSSLLHPSPDSAELTHDGKQITLAQGDMMAHPVDKSTSIAFSASLCFPDDLLARLTEKLLQELPPGAIFWSLKELPRAGHRGLVLVARLAVHSSWSSQSRLLVYTRAPEVRLPGQLPLQSLQASVGLLVQEARSMFEALALALTSNVGGDAGKGSAEVPLEGGPDLPEEVLLALGAQSAPSGLRLLRAFGAPRSRIKDDLCGCGAAESTASWSLTLAELCVALGHGLYLQNGTDASCLTLSQACTLGDMIAYEIFEMIRKDERCREDERHCRASGDEGELGRQARSMHGWPCVRSSDGRTLLEAAIFRDRPDLGEGVLEAAGNTSFACADHEGQNALHVAVRHAGRTTLAWIIELLLEQGDAGREAFTRPDAWGRVPAGLVRNAAVLHQLGAAGALGGEAVSAADASGKTPLAHAASRGDLELARALLELGADATVGGPDSSPLLLAARTRHRGGPGLVRLLAAHRADIHAQHGAAGTTAMHVAASHGGPETVKVLLELGAQPDVQGLQGMRPADLTTDPAVLELLAKR